MDPVLCCVVITLAEMSNWNFSPTLPWTPSTVTLPYFLFIESYDPFLTRWIWNCRESLLRADHGRLLSLGCLCMKVEHYFASPRFVNQSTGALLQNLCHHHCLIYNLLMRVMTEIVQCWGIIRSGGEQWGVN